MEVGQILSSCKKDLLLYAANSVWTIKLSCSFVQWYQKLQCLYGLSYSILIFPSSTDGIMREEPVWKLDRFINSCLHKLRSEILSCTEVCTLQIVCGQYKMDCSHVQPSVKSQEGMHTDPALTYCKQ